MLVLQNIPVETAELPGLKVTPAVVDTETAKFDLTLYFRERDGLLRTAVEYNTDLFEAQTIRRMMGHFQTLLEGIISDPDQRLSDLPLLTNQERHQMLVEWNQTHVEFPKEMLLHQLFEKQVEKSPQAVAVEFGENRLTYDELNHRANQLAHYLRSLGIRPDQLVGVFMERSLEMVVALYGILKAGGAYVPIDPEYPQDRVAFMVEDAGFSVLLTQSHLAGKLPPNRARAVCLDSNWDEVARESAPNRRTSLQQPTSPI